MVTMWSIFSVIFLAGYTANLAACLLALREGHNLWHSMEDVINDEVRICTPGHSALRYMKENYPQYHRVVPSGRGIDNMKAGKCEAAIMHKSWLENCQVKEDMNPTCTLHQAGQRLTSSYSG